MIALMAIYVAGSLDRKLEKERKERVAELKELMTLIADNTSVLEDIRNDRQESVQTLQEYSRVSGQVVQMVAEVQRIVLDNQQSMSYFKAILEYRKERT